MGINFSWDVRFGDLLVIIGAFITVGTWLYHSGGSLQKLQDALAHALAEISELKDEMKAMGKVMTELAVQKEQINMLMKWYDELRHGRGFVRKSVDREYP